MKLTVLVPVKELKDAKARLAPLYPEAVRRGLAWVMLGGVLDSVAALPGPLRKVVVTSDGEAAELAEEKGFEVFREERQISESDSVDRASALLEQEGISGVLRVPLDLPCLRTEDLEQILARARDGVGAVIVPSRDRDGTNGLYRAPPTLFPSRFGPGSLALHEALARQMASRWEVLPLPSMALDVDDPADVAELLAGDVSGPAREFLERMGTGKAGGKRAERG